ncbi:MAG TPA: pyridoxamine 5'-phosphate oxidase family protein [Acidimicrobiia bacterium]|jgi:nitroimidazol reductase NimA-like FMN-containing flavoprotein (pyridoxamine 5'-phosphate oxidase superfamily)|nr:pyridoxamine 5'-phosphate oxidase family protein [Acidimicrobiia bacterium]
MEPLSVEEAMEVLDSQPVAHLGVIHDGLPYVTPMSYVVAGDRILFRTMAGKKLDALRSNPEVCIEVSTYDPDSGDWSSVIVRGTASEVEDDDTKTATITRLFDKYDQVLGSPISGGGGLRPVLGLPRVIAVSIDEISGVTSGRGFSIRTKPGRL